MIINRELKRVAGGGGGGGGNLHDDFDYRSEETSDEEKKERLPTPVRVLETKLQCHHFQLSTRAIVPTDIHRL